MACLLAILYWGVIASDRYVSEAHVVVQRTDINGGQTMDFGAVLAGAVNANRADQLLLRDHLLSIDMLNLLDSKLDLRTHYSDASRDPLSRMLWKDRSQEWFHRHYLSRVSVELDDYAGVLVVRAQAYNAAMAQRITALLVEEGERFMNGMAHRLAQEQVGFLETQVARMADKANAARQLVIAFQNKKGLVSPQGTAESLAGVINKLEAQLSELKARRGALLGYLSPTAPGIIEINLQVDAMERQIASEQSRLAAPNGQTLNRTVEEFQRLQLAAEFAQDTYKTALVALEKGRIEATRTLKKLSVLQSPTLPQYPLEPRRIYNITIFVLAALLLAGIMHLLAAIIRDHKD